MEGNEGGSEEAGGRVRESHRSKERLSRACTAGSIHKMKGDYKNNHKRLQLKWHSRGRSVALEWLITSVSVVPYDSRLK